MASTEQGTRYRVIRRLGAGGMATVSLAEDTVLGRSVALKRVYRTGDRRDMLRLKREATVGASLNHPNLVFVYDAQLQEDGDVVIVMEYVEGETLADVIGSRGPLTPTEAIRVLRGVGAALDAIHDRGIVHRDVKPANVLLGRDGTVKLADLGVADVADRTRITTPDALVGSFSYMAPEQLDGAAPSPAMDVYALAAMAYEMLAGEKARPESHPLALAHAIATQPPPDLQRAWPAAPAAAAAVLQRGMSANPAERPASAGELVRRLAAALEPERPTREVAPPPVRRAPPPPPPVRRTRPPLVAAALLALAALAVAGVLVAALASGGDKPSGPSASTPRTAPHRPTVTTRARSAKSTSGATTTRPTSSGTTTPSTTSLSTTASSGTTPSSASTPAQTPPPTATSSGTPAAAVEQFYTAAARHDYPAAWALAGPNLRSQLGGYAAFQHLFSSVRSITFQSAQVTGSSSSAATVALSTTSVQSDRTQHCTGTAGTVRGGSGWLLDHIAISCS
ncbi:MAG TPA: serine/threonine-protein kinase [Solirubrobacteraceae bacterium]|nr:serine/threonine-protein kinase [Solirubrobacteraceae bacterium]